MEEESDNPQVFHYTLLTQAAQQIYGEQAKRVLLGGAVAAFSISTECKMHSESLV